MSGALSAFCSFTREHLDKAIETDQCAQYEEDIGIGANGTKYLCANTRTVLECIRNAGLKLTIYKCGVKQAEVGPQ